MTKIIIKTAYNNLGQVRKLFNEYVDEQGFDLGFQSFAAEFKSLPGKYARPKGRLYIACDGEYALGCIALRPWSETVCEMKRLYVRPNYRHKGIGEALAVKVIDEARQIGYQKMYLDTLASLTSAVALYARLGFSEIKPYYDNPLKGTIYLALDL